MTINDNFTCHETFDDLRIGNLTIIQARTGYRFSIAPVLLSSYVRVKKRESVADLGCGSGVLSLLLAQRSKSVSIVGFELQSQVVERARRNVILNNLENRISIKQADVRSIRAVATAESFSVVVSNPPFRSSETGRKSPNAERAAARHELAGGLDDFLAATAFLLRSGGRCYFVFLAERLGELLALMRGHSLEPKRLRCVHSRHGEDARLVLVEGRKNGGTGMIIDPPLNIYEGKVYSSEILEIYGEQTGSV